MLTFLYPVLASLREGSLIRRAVVVGLHALSILTLIAGIVGIVTVLKIAFSDYLPTEATVGGMLWAVIFAAVIVSQFQIYRFHAAEIEQIADSRFTVSVVTSVLLRLLGEAYFVWCVGFGLGGFLLVLVASPFAQQILGGSAIIPGASSFAFSGLLGSVWVLAVPLLAGAAGLLFLYALAEMTLVAAEIATGIGRLVKLQEQAAAELPGMLLSTVKLLGRPLGGTAGGSPIVSVGGTEPGASIGGD
jgi:hypothetical protein